MSGGRLPTLAAGVLLGALLAATLLPSGAGAAKRKKFVVGPNNLVAPLTIPKDPRPGPVPHCRKLRLNCMRTAFKRLKQREAVLGCDHRAVFATTYRVLTGFYIQAVKQNPNLMRFPRYLFAEDALFADVYFANSRAWDRGRRVSPAWQTAFRFAATGETTASVDMLLGINAHVQNDMPFVVAALSTRTRKGVTRKPDHDAGNAILAASYKAVVNEVKRRYDPLVEIGNPSVTDLEDVGYLEMVKGWREEVWNNAERLLAAKTKADRDAVARQIEQNAENWAQVISTGLGFSGPVAGQSYRPQRDAYCAANNPDA
jgi:hypothetical protein